MISKHFYLNTFFKLTLWQTSKLNTNLTHISVNKKQVNEPLGKNEIFNLILTGVSYQFSSFH